MLTETNILILDDDISFLENIESDLSSLGCRAYLLSSGEYLFKRLEIESIDVILMDIYLPDSDGISLLKQLKAHPSFKTVPVIMLTLDPDTHLLEQYGVLHVEYEELARNSEKLLDHCTRRGVARRLPDSGAEAAGQLA